MLLKITSLTLLCNLKSTKASFNPLDNPLIISEDLSEFGNEVEQYRTELEKIYTPKEKEAEEEKEFFIPRFIRATEQKIKERKAAKIEKEQSEKIIDEFTLD